MKRFFLLILTLAGSFAWAARPLSTAAENHSHETNAFTPDTIPWGPAPPVVRPGAQFAVLEGDPTASSGDYTIRLKMPDGFRISPHWHPERENVTVISGTFKVGMGDEFDASKMAAFTQSSEACVVRGHDAARLRSKAAGSPPRSSPSTNTSRLPSAVESPLGRVLNGPGSGGNRFLGLTLGDGS